MNFCYIQIDILIWRIFCWCHTWIQRALCHRARHCVVPMESQQPRKWCAINNHDRCNQHYKKMNFIWWKSCDDWQNKHLCENYTFNFFSIVLYKLVRVIRLLFLLDWWRDSLFVVASWICSILARFSALSFVGSAFKLLSGFVLVVSAPNERTKSN